MGYNRGISMTEILHFFMNAMYTNWPPFHWK